MATLGRLERPAALPASRPQRHGSSVSLNERVARSAAAISLLGLLAGSLLVVVIAAERPSFLTPLSERGFFPPWLAGPLHGLWPQLTGDGTQLEWLLSALMAAMFVLYLIASSNVRRLRARWTIVTIVAIHLIFVLAPPLSYTDVFNYVNYGRMGAVHHLNPYTTVPLLEPHDDPSFPLSNWHHLLSPYGPLFTLFTYALVPLGVVASFWALKLTVMLASLATLGLLWRCAQLLGRDPVGAIAFVGLNPVVLVWGLGADHNDSLMVLFAVLAAYLLLRAPRAARAGGVSLVCAIFVKASAAVMLPVFLFAGGRRRFALGALSAAVVLTLASVGAFGLHPPAVSTQSRLVAAISPPNLLGLAIGQGGETAAVRAVFEVSLILAIGACALWTARRPADWLAAAACAQLALLVGLGWSGPWYVLWVLPFAALAGGKRLRAAAVALGVYFLLAYLPATPMLAGAIGFHPESTRLGVAHREETELLVR
ncbi:MAG: hypothetical protein H0X28_02245 [Solirubrobacterales bacterium]|nr:hypothetical protein [Solirubrobacterales bacterium]